MLKVLITTILLCISTISVATTRGVILDKTRVIFSESQSNASVTVSNQSDNNIWLLRSWIENYNEKTPPPFVITPPLTRLDGGNSIQLRINRKETVKLPSDRESVFLINALVIPPKGKANNSSKSGMGGDTVII